MTTEQNTPDAPAVGIPVDWLVRPAIELERMEAMNEDIADSVSKALRRAWQLGQTYWQQADSESYTQNARSGQTQAMFMTLVADTCAAVVGYDYGAAERERCAHEVDVALGHALEDGYSVEAVQAIMGVRDMLRGPNVL